MSRPWMKFYPSDWQADPALRVCSVGARGLWMEMLCVMHKAVPYGSLIVNGQPVSDRQIAGLAGTSFEEAAKLIGELEAAGVFSRDGHGVIYSRRMRREEEKMERDKANGATGGNPYLKGGVNPPVNRGDKAQTLDARTQNLERDLSLRNVEAKGWTPPRHGATSTKNGRVYVESGTPEWEAYASDYRRVHRRDPEPNKHGGKWFKTLGEADGNLPG